MPGRLLRVVVVLARCHNATTTTYDEIVLHREKNDSPLRTSLFVVDACAHDDDNNDDSDDDGGSRGRSLRGRFTRSRSSMHYGQASCSLARSARSASSKNADTDTSSLMPLRRLVLTMNSRARCCGGAGSSGRRTT